MNYLNTEERKTKRRQFAVLYISTIVIIILICSAFFTPPQVDVMPAEVKEASATKAVVIPVDKDAEKITTLNEQWLQLQEQRNIYNAIKAKNISDEELAKARQALEDKKDAFKKTVDSMSTTVSTNNASPQLAKTIEVYRKALVTPFVSPAVAKTSNADTSQNLQMLLQEKDKKIQQLKEELNSLADTKGNTGGNTKPSSSNNTKFLNWALSSQTAAVAKLRSENEKLKAQINDLKKYLQ